MVLLGGKDTGGKVGEGTGWVIGFIKVEDERSIRLKVGDQITPGGIGFIFAGGVPKAQEEGVLIFFVDIQFVGFAVELEGDIAFDRELGFFAGEVSWGFQKYRVATRQSRWLYRRR